MRRGKKKICVCVEHTTLCIPRGRRCTLCRLHSTLQLMRARFLHSPMRLTRIPHIPLYSPPILRTDSSSGKKVVQAKTIATSLLTPPSAKDPESLVWNSKCNKGEMNFGKYLAGKRVKKKDIANQPLLRRTSPRGLLFHATKFRKPQENCTRIGAQLH